MTKRQVDRIGSFLLIVGLALLMVGLYFYVFPYMTTRTTNDNFNVPALQTITVTWNLDKGSRIEGYFTVRGGNDDIRFSIKDPYGSVILNAGTITGRGDFAFTAESTGAYTMYFDNSYSIFTSKAVFLSYQATVIPISTNVFLTLILLGLALLLLGVSRVYQTRAKEREQVPNVPPPPPPQ